MEYKRIKWIDDDTELSAENFNHMEEGIENSQNVELIAVTDTAPSTCTIGDKYYNTTDNLIYTATGTNTWDTTGQTPIEGIFYIVFSEQSSYSYNGTTLISVGGGTEDIVISPEQPTTEDWKIWIDTDEVNNLGSEVVDNLDGNETNKAPSVNAVNNELNSINNNINSFLNTGLSTAKNAPTTNSVASIDKTKFGIYSITNGEDTPTTGHGNDIYTIINLPSIHGENYSIQIAFSIWVGQEGMGGTKIYWKSGRQTTWQSTN